MLNLRLLIALVLVCVPAFAETGAEGILTYLPQLCMQVSSPAEHLLIEQILADDNLNSSDDSRNMHVLQLEFEKLKCLHRVLSSYSFGLGLTIENIEQRREYKTIISQLALLAGSKRSELDRLSATAARRQDAIAGRAMVAAIDDFITGYAEAVDNRPKFLLHRMETKIENSVQEKIQKLSERASAPAAARPTAEPPEAVR